MLRKEKKQSHIKRLRQKKAEKEQKKNKQGELIENITNTVDNNPPISTSTLNANSLKYTN